MQCVGEGVENMKERDGNERNITCIKQLLWNSFNCQSKADAIPRKVQFYLRDAVGVHLVSNLERSKENVGKI